MSINQHKMIQGLRNQDRSTQEQTLNEYGSMVFATISRIVSRQEDAEEVYQDYS
jgi:DNA-directed RNA polymerase specialized sigma24 family protein